MKSIYKDLEDFLLHMDSQDTLFIDFKSIVVAQSPESHVILSCVIGEDDFAYIRLRFRAEKFKIESLKKVLNDYFSLRDGVVLPDKATGIIDVFPETVRYMNVDEFSREMEKINKKMV